MRRRQAADAEQRLGDRDVGALGEGAQAVLRAGDRHAVAGEDDRALRALDQLGGAGEIGLHRRGRFAAGAAHGRGRVPVELAGRLLRVLGDVDQDRPRTPLLRDLERLAHRRGDVLRAGDEIVVLRHRQGDAGDVDLLERVGADQLAADLAGDADDRRRVQHRGGDAGDHVGRARAGGRDGDADAPRRARVAVGHVRRALLVPHQRVADRVVEHRVVGGKDGAAGVAEDLGDPFAHQALPENLCTSQFHTVTFPDKGK